MDLRVQFLVCMLGGWLNRQQQAVIYYQQETVVLQEQLCGKPRPFTDSKRRHLEGKASGILKKVANLATLDTLWRWLRKLIKEKLTFESSARRGLLPVDPETEELIANPILDLRRNRSWQLSSDQPLCLACEGIRTGLNDSRTCSFVAETLEKH